MNRSWTSRKADVLALWAARSQRERRLLQCMAALLLPVAFWYGVWQPWAAWRVQARRQLVAVQTQLLALRAIETEVLRLRKQTAAPAPDARGMEAALHLRAARLQLVLPPCRALATSTLECDGEVAFDQWVRLLASLQEAPVLPVTWWRVEAAGTPGLVRLSMRLEGGGS